MRYLKTIMTKYGKYIAFFLLLLFSFMQVVELHALDSEHDSHDDCAMCHFSIEKNEQTYILNPTIIIPQFVAVFVSTTNEIAIDQGYIFNTIISLQNKAPPTSVDIA